VALGLLTWALTEASASGADSRWLWLVAIAGMATLAVSAGASLLPVPLVIALGSRLMGRMAWRASQD
jgi:hypothetical protein